MNFVILGDGPEERSWGEALLARPEHRVVAAAPGFPGLPTEVARPGDLDGALAASGVEAVIVGGSPEFRDEALRRAAAAGFPTICLHPPGPNADPYYQVALSREETGAIVVPDLPMRLHPGIVALREALARGEIGALRGLRVDAPGDGIDADLARGAFPRWVDLVRVFLGEVESLTAMGDPPGVAPTSRLTVQLRCAGGRLAEVRLRARLPGMSAVVALVGEEGTLSLEARDRGDGPDRLVRGEPGSPVHDDLPPFDRHGAILEVFAGAVDGRATRPNLLDGTRAMELTSALTRGLRKGRSVDLHYEEVSESNNFKTVMTSVGCMVLLGILVALPAALVGPALGIGQTIYIAYAIPPILVLFALLQLTRLGLKPARRAEGADLEEAEAGTPSF